MAFFGTSCAPARDTDCKLCCNLNCINTWCRDRTSGGSKCDHCKGLIIQKGSCFCPQPPCTQCSNKGCINKAWCGLAEYGYQQCKWCIEKFPCKCAKIAAPLATFGQFADEQSQQSFGGAEGFVCTNGCKNPQCTKKACTGGCNFCKRNAPAGGWCICKTNADSLCSGCKSDPCLCEILQTTCDSCGLQDDCACFVCDTCGDTYGDTSVCKCEEELNYEQHFLINIEDPRDVGGLPMTSCEILKQIEQITATVKIQQFWRNYVSRRNKKT